MFHVKLSPFFICSFSILLFALMMSGHKNGARQCTRHHSKFLLLASQSIVSLMTSMLGSTVALRYFSTPFLSVICDIGQPAQAPTSFT